MLRGPRLEAGVAGTEIIFLLIAGPVGNVALAIEPKDGTVGIGDGDAVVITRTILLEEGDRNDDVQLLGEFRKRQHARMFSRGVSGREPFRVLARREVNALEQLRRQHDLRTLLRRVAGQTLDLGDIRRHVVAERRLQRGNTDHALRHLERLLLRDAMERAAARIARAEQAVRGKADHFAVRKQLLQGLQRFRRQTACRRRARRRRHWR